MLRSTSLRRLLTVFLLFSAGLHESSGALQQVPPTEPPTVTLQVRIEDKQGSPPPSIAKEMLEATSGKITLPIVSVTPAVEESLAIGLLLDRSGSRRGAFEGKAASEEIRLSGQFLETLLRSQDQFFISMLVDDEALSSPLSSDKKKIAELLAEVERRKPYGSSPLYATIADAVDRLASAGTERRALLIITDGGDNASGSNLQQTINHVLKGKVSLFLIVSYEPNARPRDIRRNLRAAEDLTRQTGGFYLEVRQPDDLQSALDRMLNQIRSQFLVTLAYPQDARRGKPMRIRIRSAEERWKVHHPESFYPTVGK